MFLMQSYGEISPIPRNFSNSSPTCVDKSLNLGQIGEIASKSVQCSEAKCFGGKDIGRNGVVSGVSAGA
jgi:hypothetical protein